MLFLMQFGFTDWRSKKKLLVGSILDPGIAVLTCQLQHLVLYSFSGCIEYSAAGPIGV